MDGFNHAASVLDGRQVVALQRDRVFGHYGIVRSLVDADFTAGRWTATWDGRDASGRQLVTGVYFSRLTVNGRVAATSKVVIAK